MCEAFFIIDMKGPSYMSRRLRLLPLSLSLSEYFHAWNLLQPRERENERRSRERLEFFFFSLSVDPFHIRRRKEKPRKKTCKVYLSICLYGERVERRGEARREMKSKNQSVDTCQPASHGEKRE